MHALLQTVTDKPTSEIKFSFDMDHQMSHSYNTYRLITGVFSGWALIMDSAFNTYNTVHIQ